MKVNKDICALVASMLESESYGRLIKMQLNDRSLDVVCELRVLRVRTQDDNKTIAYGEPVGDYTTTPKMH